MSVAISAGALVDTSGNKSAAKSAQTLTPVSDSTKPTWGSNVTVSSNTNSTLKLTITATDDKGFSGTSTLSLKTGTSSWGSSGNVTVKIGGVQLTSGVTFSPSLSTDKKTQTFTITISNYTGGTVSVVTDAGAVKDAARNSIAAKTFTTITPTADTTAPTWDANVASITSSGTTYTVNVKASDNAGISTTSLATSYVTVTVNGASQNFTIGTVTTNGKEKTFPINISNYSGGNISIQISAGALKDGANNSSAAKTYTISPPNWDSNIISAQLKGTTLTIKVKGTDDSSLNASSSSLAVKTTWYTSTGNLTITAGSTTVTSTNATITETVTDSKTLTYTIVIKNFTQGNNVTLAIDAGALVDGDTAKSAAKTYTIASSDIEIILTAILKSTSSETSNTSGFLGNTSIQRQYIESVTFVDGFDGMTSNNWDVSQNNVGTIKAWYTGSNPYQVYIGSDAQIELNENSSYLFAHIGRASTCKAKYVINNLDLVDTSNMTNASYMFYYCGYNAMTRLDLGDNFVTTKLTAAATMNYMFDYCGTTAMKVLNLGKGFTQIPYDYTRSGWSYVTTPPTNFITDNTGASGCKIFCTSEIFSSSSALKATYKNGTSYGSSGTAPTISYTRGTVIQFETTAPTWSAKPTKSFVEENNSYTYTIKLVGNDDTAINPVKSQLNSTNTTVIFNDVELTEGTDFDFVTPTTTPGDTTGDYGIKVYNLDESGGIFSISVNPGALEDESRNTVAEIAYTVTADFSLPEWSNTLSGKDYDLSAKTYYVTITGGDEIGLNTTESTLANSDVSVTVGGSAGTITVANQVFSEDNKTTMVQLAISNYTQEKEIVITVKAGALVDTDDNTSEIEKFTFTPDITAPRWTYSESNSGYDEVSNSYSFSIMAEDNTGIDSTLTMLTSSKITIKDKDSKVIDQANIVIGEPELSGDGKTKTFPVTVKNYTGGALNITIPGGLAVDTMGNSSDAATTIALQGVDIERPIWTYEEAGFIGTNATLYLVASDDVRIFSNNLTSINDLTITVDDVKITNATLGSRVDLGDGKNGSKYLITIPGYTGGYVKITVPKDLLLDTDDKYSIETILEVGAIPPANDTDIPVITKQTVSQDSTARTITLVFDVTDENFDFTQSITSDEISVTNSWSGWGSSRDITATITNEQKLENGKRYTVVISGLTGYSGTIKVTIAADAVTDLVGKGNEQTVIEDEGFSFSWGMTSSSAHFVKKDVTINKSLKEMYIDVIANKKNTSWAGWWSNFKFTTDTVSGLTIDGENVKGKLTVSVAQLDYNDGSSNTGSGGGFRRLVGKLVS